jgi:transcriptional regulator with XRE-family HTH domain
MYSFAEQLRRVREAKGMTRYRLAKLSGLSSEGVNKLEQPRNDPKLSTLLKLANALGVSLYELLPAPEAAPKRAKSNRQRKK